MLVHTLRTVGEVNQISLVSLFSISKYYYMQISTHTHIVFDIYMCISIMLFAKCLICDGDQGIKKRQENVKVFLSFSRFRQRWVGGQVLSAD